MNTVELSLPLHKPWDWAALRKAWRLLGGADLAVDLGTANTLVYLKGEGIVLNQPSVIAFEPASGRTIAAGQAAKEMLGKTSTAIRCVRPLRDGVIADFKLTAALIRRLLSELPLRGLCRPRAVIGIPCGITQVEKRAVIDAALCAGMRNVNLMEEPMAAALGTGLPVDQPVGTMVVDIGGGTTEVAVLTNNETVYSHSIRVAGDEMDEAIQRHLQKRHGLQIGALEAERIKLLIGSALPCGKRRFVSVCGRDAATLRPRRIEICDDEIRSALQETIAAIISSVTTALEHISAAAAQDIIARGVHLCGGGALLKGLAERLARETGIPFNTVPDPLTCVVRGAGRVIEHFREFKIFCIA